jgi:hypothetical protein
VNQQLQTPVFCLWFSRLKLLCAKGIPSDLVWPVWLRD